jgi:predicted transcriptional regulator
MIELQSELVMSTKVITAHVPLELAEKVDSYAAQLDRSRGWIVKQALADWIFNEEEKDRLTLEAIADVEAGNVIGDETMQEWIESLYTDAPLTPPHER